MISTYNAYWYIYYLLNYDKNEKEKLNKILNVTLRKTEVKCTLLFFFKTHLFVFTIKVLNQSQILKSSNLKLVIPRCFSKLMY